MSRKFGTAHNAGSWEKAPNWSQLNVVCQLISVLTVSIPPVLIPGSRSRSKKGGGHDVHVGWTGYTGPWIWID